MTDMSNCGASTLVHSVRPSGRRALRAAAAAALVGAGLVAAVPVASAAPVDLALNTSAVGLPSPLESDRGWGGGALPWEIVDGKRGYPEWNHGLAFTGGHTAGAGSGGWVEPCGPRQATINLGATRRFDKVVIWHHGEEHVPAVAKVEVWDGSAWKPVASTRLFGAERDLSPGGSVSDSYSFASTSASKVRYGFDNCGNTLSGIPMVHGWLYEFEVFDTAGVSGGGAGSDPTKVVISGGSLGIDKPDVGDFDPVTLDGTPKTTAALMAPFGVVDATGTGAGFKVTIQASQFAEVDGGGGYVPSGRVLPAESLSMAQATVAASGTKSAPPVVSPGPYVIDGAGAVKLLSAAPLTGMGRYVVTPGGLTLSVPGDAFASTFRSDVTLSLVSGP